MLLLAASAPGCNTAGHGSAGRHLCGAFGLVTVRAQPAAQGALPVLRAATDPQAHGGDYYGPGGLGEGRGSPPQGPLRQDSPR
jgi:hypothetical protein